MFVLSASPWINSTLYFIYAFVFNYISFYQQYIALNYTHHTWNQTYEDTMLTESCFVL